MCTFLWHINFRFFVTLIMVGVTEFSALAGRTENLLTNFSYATYDKFYWYTQSIHDRITYFLKIISIFHINIWQIFIYFLSTLNSSRCPVEGPDHHTMKMYGGVAPHILNLITRWRWLVSFTLSHFTLGEWSPITQWIWSSVGHAAGADTLENRKISCFLPAIDYSSVIQPLVYSLYQPKFRNI
jgi:hypothetical protein